MQLGTATQDLQELTWLQFSLKRQGQYDDLDDSLFVTVCVMVVCNAVDQSATATVAGESVMS